MTTWMNIKSIMLSETNQRQILYSITYMWNLKEQNSETEESGGYQGLHGQ